MVEHDTQGSREVVRACQHSEDIYFDGEMVAVHGRFDDDRYTAEHEAFEDALLDALDDANDRGYSDVSYASDSVALKAAGDSDERYKLVVYYGAADGTGIEPRLGARATTVEEIDTALGEATRL